MHEYLVVIVEGDEVIAAESFETLEQAEARRTELDTKPNGEPYLFPVATILKFGKDAVGEAYLPLPT